MPVVSNVLLRRRGFLTEREIKARIKSSKNYDGTDPDAARALLVFRTSKQQTWLVATSKRLYCVLDDLPKDRANVNWSLGRNVLFDEQNKFSAHIDVRPRTERTGLLDIGPKRNWLLTKGLFAEAPADSIREFIAGAMT